MGSNFYSKTLPDYGDLDNKTGKRPGYNVYIIENDGGISLQFLHPNEDPGTSQKVMGVFMNVDEAKEFVASMQAAIRRAEPKDAGHKNRGKEC